MATLTSLRDHLPLAEPSISSDDLPQSTPIDITLLERKRKTLVTEIDNLNKAIQRTHEKAAAENDLPKLYSQKKIILGQIKELVESFNILKSSKEKILEAYGKFGRERSEALDGIARSLSLEVAKETARLSKKSAELTTWDQLLTDFADYFSQLAQICEAESLSVALERVNLEKEGKVLVLQEESLKSKQDKTTELLSRAENLVKLADDRYRDADSTASFFEKHADKERKTLAKVAKTLSVKEKTLIAERKSVIDRENALLELKRLIEDKDRALNRKARELKIMI